MIKAGTRDISLQWQLFRESDKDWLSSQYFHTVNNATATGAESRRSPSAICRKSTPTIPRSCGATTATSATARAVHRDRHQHSWTYTAKRRDHHCQVRGRAAAPMQTGGSVTIAAPAELTYMQEGKPATVTAKRRLEGSGGECISPLATSRRAKYGPENWKTSRAPTNAGTLHRQHHPGQGDRQRGVYHCKGRADRRPTAVRQSYGTTPILCWPTLLPVQSLARLPAFDGALSREAARMWVSTTSRWARWQ